MEMLIYDGGGTTSEQWEEPRALQYVRARGGTHEIPVCVRTLSSRPAFLFIRL